jgi:protein-tyrosine-phosphatase/predicted ATP-grasp superfamily ATP-dependent carboligase
LFKDALAAAIDRHKFDMLMPCSDPGLVAALGNYEWLRSRLHLGCPEPTAVRRVLSKDQTLAVAAQCGIPVPERIPIQDVDTLTRLRHDLRFPLIAKPQTKEDETKHTFKMRYFGSFDELRDAFLLDAQFGSNHLIQEYCAGEGVGVELMFHQGEAVAVFQHRRVKELPISGGGSVTCISEPVDAALLEQAMALLLRLKWEGVAMVEFKRDTRSKRSVLMEVNGRYWGSLPLAIGAGIDFPLYEWQLAHGEEPKPPERYPIGMRYRWLAGDIRRIASLLCDETNDGFPKPRLTSELFSFMADFRYGTCPALWSWSDPVPAIAETAAAAKKCVGGVAKRIAFHLKSARDNYRYHGGAVLFYVARLRMLSSLGLRHRKSLPVLTNASSILLVCHGNIIRSAMAEALLRREVSGQPDLRNLSIESAGLTREPEARADRRARMIACEFGVSLESHYPTRIRQEQIDKSDVILIMDALNEAYLALEFPKAKSKIVYFGNLRFTSKPRKDCEIADPHSGTLADMRGSFLQLEQCARRLATLIEKPGWNTAVAADDLCQKQQPLRVTSELNAEFTSNRSTT